MKIRWFILNLRSNNTLIHIFRITITFPVMCTAFNKVTNHKMDGVTKK